MSKKETRRRSALFVTLTTLAIANRKGLSPVVSYSDTVSKPHAVMIKEPHAAVAVMAVLGSQRLPRAAVGAHSSLRPAEPSVPHVDNNGISGRPFASQGDPVAACFLLRLPVCRGKGRAAGSRAPVTRGALLF